MDYSVINIILDIVLVMASIWMLVTIRGIGGLMGRTLTFIVIGALILGAAHLIATLVGPLVGSALNNVIHRVIVLVGFIFLALGFRQLQSLK